MKLEIQISYSCTVCVYLTTQCYRTVSPWRQAPVVVLHILTEDPLLQWHFQEHCPALRCEESWVCPVVHTERLGSGGGGGGRGTGDKHKSMH